MKNQSKAEFSMTVKPVVADIVRPGKLDEKLEAVKNTSRDLREYEIALRDARAEVARAKMELVEELVELKMYECLTVNMAAINKCQK